MTDNEPISPVANTEDTAAKPSRWHRLRDFRTGHNARFWTIVGVLAALVLVGGAAAVAIGEHGGHRENGRYGGHGERGGFGERGGYPGHGPLGAPERGRQTNRNSTKQQVIGTVSSIGSSTLTISSGGSPKTFAITSDTSVVASGGSAALSGLKSGEAVVVTEDLATTVGGNPVAAAVYSGMLPKGETHDGG